MLRRPGRVLPPLISCVSSLPVLITYFGMLLTKENCLSTLRVCFRACILRRLGGFGYSTHASSARKAHILIAQTRRSEVEQH